MAPFKLGNKIIPGTSQPHPVQVQNTCFVHVGTLHVKLYTTIPTSSKHKLHCNTSIISHTSIHSKNIQTIKLMKIII